MMAAMAAQQGRYATDGESLVTASFPAHNGELAKSLSRCDAGCMPCVGG
jgi:hypothetical protein